MDSILDILKDICSQVTQLGPELLTIVVCWIIGIIVRKIPQIPNNYIPILCPFIGMVIYPLIADPKIVSKSITHPVVALSVMGFIFGFLSWMAYKAILKGLEDKFPSIKNWLNNGEEDTKP